METNKVIELVLENVENLLVEGRVENIKKKYPGPNAGHIDSLVEADPSKTNKFLEWATKLLLPHTIQWFKKNASDRGYYSYTLDEVPDTSDDARWSDNYSLRRNLSVINDNTLSSLRDNLEHFFKNPSKYEIKDINQFNTIQEFNDAAELAKQKLSRKEMKETGIDKVYEDEDFILLMPKTHKAACRYGAHTRWCVTMRGYSGYFENYFGQGPIFFLIDKRRPSRSYSPQYMQQAEDYWKVAIHYRPFNGRLSQNGQRALQLARTLDKEAFIDGANIGNTIIDYWNVSDDRKKESVVGRYLGGPGRGQSQRAQVIFNKLKEVMEIYTKRVLSTYYDSLGNEDDILDKIEELKETKNNLQTNSSNLYYKSERLSDAIRQLEHFLNRLNTDEGDDKYREWVTSQLETASTYRDEIDDGMQSFDNQLEVVNGNIDDLEDKLSSEGLVFYDKEKNTQMER